MVLPKSGTLNNSLFCIIFSDTLAENWGTCFRMYRRNASLHHLLMIVIVSGVTTARYISTAASECRECAPISIVPKHNCPLPRIWTAAVNFVRIPAEVMVRFFPFVYMKLLA